MEIKDPAQLEKAKLEDVITELLYRKYNDIVFHGGTSIWRCYSGNRFSRDLDFYLKATDNKERMLHYAELADFLKESGFRIKEKGYDNSTETMHILVESNAKMKIDINFNYKTGLPTEYRKADDSKIIVLSLSPLELLKEKIIAYNDKLGSANKFKQTEVQDLYDMYYLVSLINKADKKTVKELSLLVERIEKTPPPNMSSLGHLILAGLPPSFELMIESLRKWLHDNS